MINQNLSPQEDALREVLAFTLLRAGSAVLLPALEAGAIAPMSSQVYLSTLGTLAKRGVEGLGPNVYLDGQYYSYTISPYNSSVDYSRSDTGPFHEEMISLLGINAQDLSEVHETTIPYLLNTAGERALALAVENSTPEQVKSFLAKIVPATTSDQRSDNKSSVAGLLLFCQCDEVMKKVQEKLPDWGQTLDHRKRNILFYCRTEEDFNKAVASGADTTQKDKHGRDIATWWNLARTPNISAQLCSLLSELGHSGSPSNEDLMVNKLMRLGFEKFDAQDHEEFKKASSNKDWRWAGTLEGVKHNWTLAEIWKFGELCVISSHSSPLDTKFTSEFSYSRDRRHLKSALPRFVQNVRAQLPSDFRAQLATPGTAFEYALDFLGLVAPANLSDAKSNNFGTNSYYSGEDQRVYSQFSTKHLSSLDKEKQVKLIEGLDVVRDAKWAWDPLILNPVLSEIAGRTAASSSILVRDLWCKYYLSVPMKHAFHAGSLQKLMNAYLQLPPIVRSDFDDPLTAQVQIKTMGGIGNDNGYQDDAWKYLNGLVEDGALKGVEIPTRWLKNLQPESRVVVSKALLENKAAAKRKDIPEPASSESNFRPKM